MRLLFTVNSFKDIQIFKQIKNLKKTIGSILIFFLARIYYLHEFLFQSVVHTFVYISSKLGAGFSGKLLFCLGLFVSFFYYYCFAVCFMCVVLTSVFA